MEMKLRSLFLPLILINCAAVLTGMYFYSDQLAATAPQLLIFVPDCPLFVLLALLIMLGIMRNDIFSFFVSVGMVKYGLWTVFVLLFHWSHYSQPFFFWTTIIFILGHLGMAFEGLALLPARRIAAPALALVILIFLIYDFSDYWLGTVPEIPAQGLGLVRDFTIAASIALPLILWKYGKRIRELPLASQLREIIGV